MTEKSLKEIDGPTKIFKCVVGYEFPQKLFLRVR